MKRLAWLLVFVIAISATQDASAQLVSLNLSGSSSSNSTRLIVRDTLGVTGLNASCLLLGCTVLGGLGDPDGQLFVISTPSILNPVVFILRLVVQPGIVGIEFDQPVQLQGAKAGPAPYYLTDKTPVNYYGTTVWEGYTIQPAVGIIRSDAAHTVLNSTGNGVVVGVIDTGVDVNSSVLQPFLVPGYDFTRNTPGGDENGDINQSTVAVLDSSQTAYVNQSTVAVLDQSTVAVLDGNKKYAAFGHGTMTSGIVHLVAPQARIMPLKAFSASGTGNASDVLRAIYYGVNHGSKVLNMSFDFTVYSPELRRAVNYANLLGVICVASAGNDGKQTVVYPAGLANVIDVASTANDDTRSSFSNYGAPPVWLAAPGEGIMTTYPYNTYAAGWGTSFSTPMVSGTAALMASGSLVCTESQVAQALKDSQPIADTSLAGRRLDVYKAVQSYRTTLGLWP